MKIKLSSSLVAAAGGRAEFDVEPGTINQILLRLGKQYPELEAILEEGVAVAVDDVIYRGDFTTQVHPTSEVFLLTKIVGG